MQCHQSGYLAFYIDLHAHATKRGCFLFGNKLPLPDLAEAKLFCHAIAQHSPFFEAGACAFNRMSGSDRKGDSIKGTSRIAMWKATGLVHCYTLEAHYTWSTREGSKPYTTANFKNVGKALGDALLEMAERHPSSKFRRPYTLKLAKEKIFRAMVQKKEGEVKSPSPKKLIKLDAPLEPVRTPLKPSRKFELIKAVPSR